MWSGLLSGSNFMVNVLRVSANFLYALNPSFTIVTSEAKDCLTNCVSVSLFTFSVARIFRYLGLPCGVSAIATRTGVLFVRRPLHGRVPGQKCLACHGQQETMPKTRPSVVSASYEISYLPSMNDVWCRQAVHWNSSRLEIL